MTECIACNGTGRESAGPWERACFYCHGKGVADPAFQLPAHVIGRKRAFDKGEPRRDDHFETKENGERRRVVPKLRGKRLKKFVEKQEKKPLFVSRFDPSTVDPIVFELGIVQRPA